jgi:hypothetical protein
MRKEIESLIDKHDESCEKRGIDPKTGEPKPTPQDLLEQEAFGYPISLGRPVLPANFPTPRTP